MCDKKNMSDKELIIELHKRGLFTNAKSNNAIIKNIDDLNNIQLILTTGQPKDVQQCRECKKILPSNMFKYYLSRVDKNGYLMRSNALCHDCINDTGEERKIALKNVDKNNKPKSGDTCPHCNRSWTGNWHRHHEGDKFIQWLCGHCNMSFSDQRNKSSKQKL